jgi:hypothetical protein
MRICSGQILTGTYLQTTSLVTRRRLCYWYASVTFCPSTAETQTLDCLRGRQEEAQRTEYARLDGSGCVHQSVMCAVGQFALRQPTSTDCSHANVARAISTAVSYTMRSMRARHRGWLPKSLRVCDASRVRDLPCTGIGISLCFLKDLRRLSDARTCHRYLES